MMFTSTSTTGIDMNESMDSKYTVADILSSMANGEPLAPTYSGATPTLASGVSSAVPLLTPTTLATLEQTFTELQSIPTTSSSGNSIGQLSLPTFNRTTESGFVPPVINMVKQEFTNYSTEDPEWLPPGQKRARITTASAIPQSVIRPTYSTSVITGPSAPVTPRRHTGPRPPRREENLTPEEARKRGVRRERNKLAAAKCRQRRVDLTNTLLAETEELEEEQTALENDIQNLQQQKEQLEFLLQAHKPLCHAKKNGQVPVVKTEKPTVTAAASGLVAPTRPTGSTITSRPNTLPLPTQTVVTRSPVTEATGVSITTPSSGVIFNFGLESMMDGHTGLTPLTGGPSCASQVQRSSSDSSPSDALSSPTTLMAL